MIYKNVSYSLATLSFSFRLDICQTLPAMQKTWVQSLGQEDLLEKGMATHSSILAWRIPWTEETGRLQSMRSQRVRHGWAHSTQSPTGWPFNPSLTSVFAQSPIVLPVISQACQVPTSANFHSLFSLPGSSPVSSHTWILMQSFLIPFRSLVKCQLLWHSHLLTVSKISMLPTYHLHPFLHLFYFLLSCTHLLPLYHIIICLFSFYVSLPLQWKLCEGRDIFFLVPHLKPEI